MNDQVSFWQSLASRRLWVVFVLGISSGLPLLLTGGTLKTWLARENVDIATIGYFSWVSMAYSLKFLWAPLLDYFEISAFGRRRSWLLLTQLGLALLLFALSLQKPETSLMSMVLLSILIAFLSATQDVVIDAHRRETLPDHELGLGSSLYQYGYRAAMYISGGIGIGLVGLDSSTWGLTWGGLYQLMAFIMAGLFLFTWLLVPEPPTPTHDRPHSLMAAITEPFREFLTRDQAWMVLAFVFLFKLGDALSGSMLNPFYVQMGYSNQDIGVIAKTIGMLSLLFGLFLGSAIIYRLGILRSLWVFGVLQGLSTAGFSIITFVGPQNWALALAVIFEDISAGMGSAAFLAYLATLTDKRFTATQYALLSSLALLGRTFFSGFMGEYVKLVGWTWFFWTCALVAIPGLVLLKKVSAKAQPTPMPVAEPSVL